MAEKLNDELKNWFLEKSKNLPTLKHYAKLTIRDQSNGFAVVGHFGPSLSSVNFKIKVINEKIKVILNKNSIELGTSHEFETKEEALSFLKSYFTEKMKKLKS